MSTTSSQNQARTQLKLTLQPTPAGLGHTLLYPALLMGGVAADANAAIVTVTGSPVTVGNNDTVMVKFFCRKSKPHLEKISFSDVESCSQ